MLFYNISIEDFHESNLGGIALRMKIIWREQFDGCYRIAFSKTEFLRPGVIAFACR